MRKLTRLVCLAWPTTFLISAAIAQDPPHTETSTDGGHPRITMQNFNNGASVRGGLNVDSVSPDATIGILHPEQCGSLPAPSWCSGSSAASWINAAVHAISSGGIVDLRGFAPGPVSVAATVSAGIEKSVTILCNPATQWIPADNSVSTMFAFGASARVDGCYINISKSARGAIKFNYTGIAIAVVGTKSSTDFNNVPFSLSNLYVYAYDNTAATGIFIMPDAEQNVSFYSFHDITVVGGLYGLYLNAASSYVNNNSFTNIVFDGCVHGIFGAGGTRSNTIFQNSFANAHFQWAIGQTKDFIYFTGGNNTVQQNSFTNLQFEDVPPHATALIMHDSGANGNLFEGALLSSFQDHSTAQTNMFLDTSVNQVWQLGGVSLSKLRNLSVDGSASDISHMSADSSIINNGKANNAFTAISRIAQNSFASICWTATSTDSTGPCDTGLSREAPGVVSTGTGAIDTHSLEIGGATVIPHSLKGYVGLGPQLGTVVSGSGVLTFSQITPLTCQERIILVPGATTLNFGVSASPRSPLGVTSVSWSAWVSSNGIISVRICNLAGQSVNPDSVSWGVTVSQ
jgi:hypothetical protein